MLAFVQSLQSRKVEHLTYLDIFKYSVAQKTFKTKLNHYWSQMRNFLSKNSSQIFEAFLQGSANNAIDLLFEIALSNHLVPTPTT